MTANLLLQTYKKTSGLFLLYRTAVGFSSHNNFTNLGSFPRVFVPVEYIITWPYFIRFGIVYLQLVSANE